MFTYNFQDSLDRIDWSTGTFKDSPTEVSQYKGGFAPSSLTLQTTSSNTTTDPQKASDKPNPKAYTARKRKKGKVILWIFLILALIGISWIAIRFWLKKRKG